MNNIDSHILNIDKVICNNIDKFDITERGLLSQNILSQLRNFIEHISLKAYSNGHDLEITYDNIEKANAYIKTIGKLKFLSGFHKLLQITTSHYTLDEENSERLMLKYFEYLIRIKSYLKSMFDLDVLENIECFPIKTDSNLKEYYEKIAEKINQSALVRIKSSYNDRYYIQKIKPFFIGFEVYYEVTFTRANDYVSKFDRIIAFTKLEISHNYAVKLSISNDIIHILGKNMPILVIDQWEISIRPCELNNFADIFGHHPKLGGTKEYHELMRYLTSTGINLVELVDFNDNYFDKIKRQVTEDTKTSHFFEILEKCREITKGQKQGCNIVKYLLYRLNNKVIKKQYYYESCVRLSELYLSFGCIPFDEMPYNSSLINHNPKLSDLFNCIDITNKQHELFARLIKNKTEQKGQLYTSRKDIINFENIDNLIETWNKSLYYKHTHRRLENYKEHIYIKSYEENTFHIIEKLKMLSQDGIKNYENSVNSWLMSSAYSIDCDEKAQALRQLFEKSKVALIYGAAGTGKSTMINHISNFFNDKNKLYLANTNPAVDNLKRKVNASNGTFKTIAKFLRSGDTADLLVIDECSTVSNSDMIKILNQANFKLLVLVGDVYQIESILFGNWFNLAKSFIHSNSIFELSKPYRSTNNNLLTLWNKVRNLDYDLLEHIARNKYSITLDESIFEHTENDEIILCLNYDGLYGINNINRFLQGSNKNTPIEWNTLTYKVNDPIIFNELDRFSPLIYNNLKGIILKIKKFEDRIQFDIEIDKVINEFEAEVYDFELMNNAENGNSVIRFIVNKFESTDDDDDGSSDTVVPFQVAYAVSIHKAQGLEYNSVKVVITDEVDEMISHNIFYTAITRAREKLKIFWTPETESKILTNFKTKFNGKDVSLLKSKYNL